MKNFENLRRDEYKCIKCGEVWGFIPSDYKYNKKKYPRVCPFCDMPVMQMIRDVFYIEGIFGIPHVIKILVARMLHGNSEC